MRCPVAFFVLALTLGACSGDGWQPAFDASDKGWLLSTWGTSESDVWAVGGQPGQGLVYHYDGSDWAPVDLGVQAPLLNWVFGFAEDDVYVVGDEGVILHYDGSSWSTESSTETESLWGIWGSSRDNMFAVGGSGRPDSKPTLLQRDASGWRSVAVPTIDRPNVFALFKVWGSGPNDVIAVGQRGVILRYDGSTWRSEASGTAEDLISLWGTSANQVVAVGGRSNGQVVTWDGQNWTHRSLAPLPGVNGVWVSDSTAHIAGEGGVLGRIDLSSMELTEDTLEAGIDPFLSVHAIFGVNQGLYAVGGSLLRQEAPFEGLAYSRELKP